MTDLQQKLELLTEELPPSDEFDEEDLFEFDMMYLEEIFGTDESIWEISEESISALPDNLLKIYYFAWYAQSVCNFFNSVAWDGLLSVFYNGSGSEIDALRAVLKRFNDPLSRIVEQAYQMLKKPYDIVPETNFVTRNRELSVHGVLPDGVAEVIEKLEGEVNDMQEACTDRVRAALAAACT